jgi:superfamily II DNA helicase RecQ
MLEKMEEIVKPPKMSIEFKQTAMGRWYAGSVKINADSIEEFGFLSDYSLGKVSEKLRMLNKEDTGIKRKEENKKAERHENLGIVLDAQEEVIFERLKRLRKEFAKKEGFPPYVIFHDSALKRLAKDKPDSVEKLREIIGEKKFRKYGEEFLKEIRFFL